MSQLENKVKKFLKTLSNEEISVIFQEHGELQLKGRLVKNIDNLMMAGEGKLLDRRTDEKIDYGSVIMEEVTIRMEENND